MAPMTHFRSRPSGSGASGSRPSWRRWFRWPLFCVLAGVHLLLLPALLPEREDAVIALAAGACYLALALADWHFRVRRSPWLPPPSP
jgi:hypothetical protein